MSRFLPGVAAFVAAVAVALLGLYASADPPPPSAADEGRGLVKVRLLGVNDFHGHLEAPRPGLGGAAWLKAHLDSATVHGRTIRVHAGDMIGASPLISSWFHDEPTIKAGNELGFDVGTLGNHEFDEGGDELIRMLRGGQRTGPDALKPDAVGRLVNTSSPDYAGATYPYVAANTIDHEGQLSLPPYAVIERAGVRIGFIGVTTRSTPKFLLERHAARFRFTDISEAVNRWVPVLQERGVRAIVVLAHAGGPSQDESAAPDFVGEIVDEAREMSPEVDAVIAGHSHSRLDIRVPNANGSGDKLIVEALSYGIAYDLVDLTIDRRTGDVVAKTGSVPATPHDLPADAGIAALVERYRARVAPLATKVLGHTEGGLTRAGGELGRLAAEAERAFAGADAAVVSPAALRADIAPGPITHGELAEALAYDHPLVRAELTGRELRALADAAGFYSGPSELEPARSYSVAASEMLLPRGRAVGTEVEAVSRYLEADK
jgi:5'-nucleotidase